MAMYGATIGKLGILTYSATTNQACCACKPVYGVETLFLFTFDVTADSVYQAWRRRSTTEYLERENCDDFNAATSACRTAPHRSTDRGITPAGQRAVKGTRYNIIVKGGLSL